MVLGCSIRAALLTQAAAPSRAQPSFDRPKLIYPSRTTFSIASTSAARISAWNYCCLSGSITVTRPALWRVIRCNDADILIVNCITANPDREADDAWRESWKKAHHKV